jgi:hypothetical protein
MASNLWKPDGFRQLGIPAIQIVCFESVHSAERHERVFCVAARLLDLLPAPRGLDHLLAHSIGLVARLLCAVMPSSD